MKRSYIYLLSGFLLLLLFSFVFIQVRSPRFVWNRVSLSPTDEQPFGTCLFDSVLSRSLPAGYRVVNSSVADWAYKTRRDSGRHSILYLVDPDEGISKKEVSALFHLAQRGEQVLVAGTRLSLYLDTLDIQGAYRADSYLIPNSAVRNFRNKLTKTGGIPTQRILLPARGGYPSDTLHPVSVFGFSGILCDTSACQVEALAEMRDSFMIESYWSDSLYVGLVPVALKLRHGRGSIMLVSGLLPFTNYGMLDPQCRTIALRLVNELKNRPVVRIYSGNGSSFTPDRGFSWLSFIAAHPPLRRGWILFVTGAMLLLVVNARRRQRAIPVWRTERNATIELLTQHASLYRSRTDHAPLLARAYRAFAARLMTRYQIDVTDTEPLERRNQADRLAHYLDLNVSEVAARLHQLDTLRDADGPLTPRQFQRGMELMRQLTPLAD